MRILIAEDEPVTQRLLEKMVSDAGHEPILVQDGVEAAQVLELERPPMAILDWNMPGLNGIEVCRQARARGGDDQPYIIFVTVRQDKRDTVTCLDEGADDFISKPFDEDELRARIRAGERILKLRDQVVKAEGARVLIETAGAAAHEINQPLTAIIGTVELMIMSKTLGKADQQRLETIHRSGLLISTIVKKMGKLRAYVTKPYVGKLRIVDFNASTEEDEAS